MCPLSGLVKEAGGVSVRRMWGTGHSRQKVAGPQTCVLMLQLLKAPQFSCLWVSAVSDLSARTASLLPTPVQHSRGRGFSIVGSFQSCQEGGKHTFPVPTSEVLIQWACGEAQESVFVFPLFFIYCICSSLLKYN